FELKHGSGGTWTTIVLHSFSGDDGATPSAGLVFDLAGNLYGITYGGGVADTGVVFRLSRNSKNKWHDTTLHSFRSNGYPNGSLILDSAGNLYGTSRGLSPTFGSVFEITPN